MKKSTLREYAHLIAVSGVNVQKGQSVIIRCDVSCPEFVEMLAEECYKLGAAEVEAEWSFLPLTKLAYEYRSEESLSTVKAWELERERYRTENPPVIISVKGGDPDGLKGIDEGKQSRVIKARYGVLAPITEARDNRYQWCVCVVPTEGWAKKVFPALALGGAVSLLWDAILKCARVETGKSVENWKQHDAVLLEKCEKLNRYNFVSMRYTSSNGTDLTVGLIPDRGSFQGGGCTTLDGVFYNPNIPTEEVFTTPKAGVAEGIVYATKPLSYNGSLVEDFFIRFAGGKAVEWGAKKGKEVLDGLIRTDEGSAMLGECALVPFDSPVNRTGLVFFNTLYDENACCHVALGRGYTDTIRGFAELSREEMHALGVNSSSVHVDFMIGAEDTSVTATTVDGEEIVVFRNGTWAI